MGRTHYRSAGDDGRPDPERGEPLAWSGGARLQAGFAIPLCYAGKESLPRRLLLESLDDIACSCDRNGVLLIVVAVVAPQVGIALECGR